MRNFIHTGFSLSKIVFILNHMIKTILTIRAQQDKPTHIPEDDLGVLTKPKVKRPSMYKVILLNDDYTPMDFVIHVLQIYFSKSKDEATKIMLQIHNHGLGICGIYPKEVAESKVTQVMAFCTKNQQPLQCTLEKE